MFTLLITAELSGVTNLRPLDTEENPFWYMFKVQCTSCREIHNNYVGVNRFRESTATVKAAAIPYKQHEPAKAQKLIEFDCRGLEFTEFKAEGEWLADGIDSGSKFSGIELIDGEWYDYDEKAGEEMAAAEILLKTKFLSDAAHLLRFAAPETSAYLMSDCADHLSRQGSCVSDIYRQHVCTACGHIMIPGHATELRLEARRSCRQKSTSHRNGAVTAPTSPSKILACGHCKSVTRIRLAAPDKAARTEASRRKNDTVPGPSIEKPKPNTNASSKKRAKTRKAGLQALLSSQQKPSAGLSLASFMNDTITNDGDRQHASSIGWVRSPPRDTTLALAPRQPEGIAAQMAAWKPEGTRVFGEANWHAALLTQQLKIMAQQLKEPLKTPTDLVLTPGTRVMLKAMEKNWYMLPTAIHWDLQPQGFAALHTVKSSNAGNVPFSKAGATVSHPVLAVAIDTM
ncbi:hypothetical protein MY4038_000388 [Beauveria bassiana]